RREGSMTRGASAEASRRRRPAGPPATAGRQANLLALLVFLAAVLVVKLGVMLQLKDHILTQPDAGLDTTAYVTLALRVINGDISLGPGLYIVSPFYIYFLAAIVGATHSFTAARVAQMLLGTVAVALVYVAANEWYGRRAAWCAAAMAASTGLFTFYETL